MPGKKLRTVEDVFINDPIEATRKKAKEIKENIRRAYPEESIKADKVSLAINRIFNKPDEPDIAKKLRELWHESVDKNITEISKLMNVDEEDMKEFIKIEKAIDKEYKKRVANPRKAAWKRSVNNSPVTVIDHEKFPKDDQRPFIVFYSADWCGPCQMLKPAYLKLSYFFDKAKLYYYASDEIFKERPEIKFVPQLVAYLANGSAIHSDCGGNAKELWKNMNLILTLGENFAGTGELICSEIECRIEPKVTSD